MHLDLASSTENLHIVQLILLCQVSFEMYWIATLKNCMHNWECVSKTELETNDLKISALAHLAVYPCWESQNHYDWKGHTWLLCSATYIIEITRMMVISTNTDLQL